jgi:hypothetical protein
MVTSGHSSNDGGTGVCRSVCKTGSSRCCGTAVGVHCATHVSSILLSTHCCGIELCAASRTSCGGASATKHTRTSRPKSSWGRARHRCYVSCALMRPKCQDPQLKNLHNETTWRPCSSSLRQRARQTHATSCQACVDSCIMQSLLHRRWSTPTPPTQLTT